VIGIAPERNLNNGQPSLHAALIAAAAPQPKEHVVHVGGASGTTRQFSRSWSAPQER
jgi:protein-L-isoaspartate(D-aspartate) O-methyltransferase